MQVWSFYFIWRYKKGSEYSDQVLTFKNNFSNVHIIIFEEFIKNGLEETNKVFDFLGLNKLTDISTMEHNVSGQPNNWLTRFILSRDNNISTIIRELIKKIIPRIILEKLSKRGLNKIEISKEDYFTLKKELIKDTLRTQDILKRIIEAWK